ncbi:MAG TPA: asparagine synthetase B, partial [Nitrospirae bacterium]|nr:asparagine synthetase B [Nitrospirota bacterium]
LRGNRRKYVLVEAFKDILPKRLHNRPKQGFDVPIGEWFKNELKDLYMSVMSEESLAETGILDPVSAREMYDLHLSGKRDLSKQLMSMFVLQWWLLRKGPGN